MSRATSSSAVHTSRTKRKRVEIEEHRESSQVVQTHSCSGFISIEPIDLEGKFVCLSNDSEKVRTQKMCMHRYLQFVFL